jgi:hypothetical protein
VRAHMLIWGTVNPEGEADSHEGVLPVRQRDVDEIASLGSLVGKPVKLEHKGGDVGRVLSAWKHGDRLDCVMEIHNNVEGLFAQDFVERGRCRELSLGYVIDMKHLDGQISGGAKRVVEVSIVKKGARHECDIRGFSK